MPLWLIREDCREYEPTVLSVDPEAAAELLEHALTERLKILVGDDGEVIRIDFETRIADGMICVTATGECLEEIGTEVAAESNSVYSGDTPNNN